MYPLKGVNVALDDYQNGPLQNWTRGGLHFNGRDQYAVLTNEDVNRTVTVRGQRGTRQRTVIRRQRCGLVRLGLVEA